MRAFSECLRANYRDLNFSPVFPWLQAPLCIKNSESEHPEWVRTDYGGFMSSEASEKVLWAKRIPSCFSFLKSHEILSQKLPLRTERKRSSIEFERSENIGQFFIPWAFNYFKVFKYF